MADRFFLDVNQSLAGNSKPRGSLCVWANPSISKNRVQKKIFAERRHLNFVYAGNGVKPEPVCILPTYQIRSSYQGYVKFPYGVFFFSASLELQIGEIEVL